MKISGQYYVVYQKWFSDFSSKADFFVEGLPEFTEGSFNLKKVSDDDVIRILQFALWESEALRAWNRDELNDLFSKLAEKLDMKIRDVLAPVFIAVSGKSVTPPLFDSLAILGPDMTRARLRHALDAAGGVSKKKLKKLEKEYRQRMGE